MPVTDVPPQSALRAGLYLSAPKPGGRALDKQRQWCQAMASMHHVEIVTEFVDAPTRRGSFEPGMRNAIAALRNGDIGALICTDPSRLSQDTQMLQYILQQIANARGWLLFAGPLTAPDVAVVASQWRANGKAYTPQTDGELEP